MRSVLARPARGIKLTRKIFPTVLDAADYYRKTFPSVDIMPDAYSRNKWRLYKSSDWEVVAYVRTLQPGEDVNAPPCLSLEECLNVR